MSSTLFAIVLAVLPVRFANEPAFSATFSPALLVLPARLSAAFEVLVASLPAVRSAVAPAGRRVLSAVFPAAFTVCLDEAATLSTVRFTASRVSFAVFFTCCLIFAILIRFFCVN